MVVRFIWIIEDINNSFLFIGNIIWICFLLLFMSRNRFCECLYLMLVFNRVTLLICFLMHQWLVPVFGKIVQPMDC